MLVIEAALSFRRILQRDSWMNPSMAGHGLAQHVDSLS